jgi:hypothetical protein
MDHMKSPKNGWDMGDTVFWAYLTHFLTVLDDPGVIRKLGTTVIIGIPLVD